MADTRAATGLTVQQWDDQFFEEYIDEGDFSTLMGTDEGSVIQVKEDLTKKPGDSITFAFVNRLTGAATEGSNVLEGNEEDMSSRSHRLYINKRRHAVRMAEMEQQRSAIDLLNAGKSVLKTWSLEDTRDRIIEAFLSINGVAYADATETQKDAWLVDNADRALFGAATANNASNDHSAALGQIDSTNDILKRNALSLMKRLAATANPKVRPVRDPGPSSKRVYIAYAHPYVFRDLRSDMESILDDTTAAGQAVKLFEGGDLMWENVIVKQLDDMPVYSNGSIDVSPVVLLGAQAIGHGIGRRWKSFTKKFDYEDKTGVAIDAIDGFAKLTFGSGSSDTADAKDHGIVTGWFSAVAD